MNFWSWLFRFPSEEDDWKSTEQLKKELEEMRKEIDILQKEICHWKHLALTFKKFH